MRCVCKNADARLAADFLSDADSVESPLLNIEDECSAAHETH